jgi:hypothetical protein
MACATSGRGWLVRVVDKAVGPRFQNFAAVPVDRAGPRHLEASSLSLLLAVLRFLNFHPA